MWPTTFGFKRFSVIVEHKTGDTQISQVMNLHKTDENVSASSGPPRLFCALRDVAHWCGPMDSYGSYDSYDSYNRSNVDVWMKSYEVVYYYHFIIEKA